MLYRVLSIYIFQQLEFFILVCFDELQIIITFYNTPGSFQFILTKIIPFQFPLNNHSMTEKQPPLQTQYRQDADLMASKSRFGFFSILPSHTAAITDYAQKTGLFSIIQLIKIKQEKSKFSKEVSIQDPNHPKSPTKLSSHKQNLLSLTVHMQILKNHKGKDFLEQTKKWQHKEIFKPARLQKTLISSAYSYKSLKPEDKTKKYRNQDGKVITQPSNICANTLSKLQYQRDKSFKYMEDPYENLQKMKKKQLDEDLEKRGEPFKSGNPVKELFSNNKKVFDDTSDLAKAQKTETTQKKQNQPDQSVKHESNFRPSSGHFTKYNGLFNPITYKQEGKLTQRPHTAGKLLKQGETFKSMSKVNNSRPCPSVSTNRMNLMRRIR